jgi:thiol-disulfide isomerase/thioredoxin
MRWWHKGLQPNMREIESAQDLADSLLNAGDKLVVVDFFSPGCGGCRALHPKVRPTRHAENCLLCSHPNNFLDKYCMHFAVC